VFPVKALVLILGLVLALPQPVLAEVAPKPQLRTAAGDGAKAPEAAIPTPSFALRLRRAAEGPRH
jgi:hypothetical protein